MVKKSQMTAGLWGLLVGLSVLWGGSFFFAEVAVETMSPFAVVFWRVLLASLTLLVFLLWRGTDLRPMLPFAYAFLLMGLLNNVVPFSLLFWGQTQISAAYASILNATTPLFTAFLAHIFTSDEKLNFMKLAGILLGVFGVAVMMSPDLLVGGVSLNIIAQGACLGAALSYGFAAIWGRRFRALPPHLTALGQLSASTLILLPLVVLTPIELLSASIAMEAYVSVVALAVLSTALAYIIFFRILNEAGSTNISLVTLLVPVSAILLESIFLRITPNFLVFLGFAFIGFGLLLIDGRFFGMIFSYVFPKKQ